LIPDPWGFHSRHGRFGTDVGYDLPAEVLDQTGVAVVDRGRLVATLTQVSGAMPRCSRSTISRSAIPDFVAKAANPSTASL
jgi:hypothetical protein